VFILYSASPTVALAERFATHQQRSRSAWRKAELPTAMFTVHRADLWTDYSFMASGKMEFILGQNA
jgi:hypothetical protein